MPPVTPDQALFVASSVHQLAHAVAGLAIAVVVAAIVMMCGYYVEYRAWKEPRD